MDGTPGRSQLSAGSLSPGFPAGTFGVIAGTVRGTQLCPRAFHPQPPPHPTGSTRRRGAQPRPGSAPAARIPAGRGTASGQSRQRRKFLGEFSSSWCTRWPCSHCVCAQASPGVSSRRLPWGCRFLSQTLPSPKPPAPACPSASMDAVGPLGEAREPGRKGSRPGLWAGLGWDIFLPAATPGIRSPLGLEQNGSAGTAGWVMAHPVRESLAASAGPGSGRWCWICRVPRRHLRDGPGPAARSRSKPQVCCTGTQSLGAAPSPGCPNPDMERWDRVSIVSRARGLGWGRADTGAPVGAIPRSARAQGRGHGGRAHPHPCCSSQPLAWPQDGMAKPPGCRCTPGTPCTLPTTPQPQ